MQSKTVRDEASVIGSEGKRPMICRLDREETRRDGTIATSVCTWT